MAFFASEGYAQRRLMGLSGVVYDSATRAPMPYVSVVNLATSTGTTTTDNGTFTLGCVPGDSLVFTMVGYSPKKRVVIPNMGSIVVFLGESFRTLNAVTVYGSFQPQGSEQWKTAVEAPRFFSNPAAPGSGYNVQTFGPGITLRGLMSGAGKSEKEKRKVAAIREKNRKTEVYNEMVASEETRSFFKTTFSMSDAEYDGFIARFNAAHRDAEYLDDKEEIKNLMVVFKATGR
jgi:hypothetical protein